MVAPVRVGWTSGTNAGGSTVALSNPAGAQAGDRVVAFISHTGAAATITNLQGWTLLSTLTFNTRRWHILERAYSATYPALSLSTGEGMLWATTAIRASSGYSLGATTLGATWRRVDNGGSINTTQAPSMTAPDDALALAFFSETSTAAEVETGTTLSGAGWAKWFWSKATAGNANPVNYVAYAEPPAGATGTATTTWANNSNNGAGVQLVIGQTSAGPSATGNLDTVGVFQNTTTSLVAGVRLITSGTVQAVLRQGGVEVVRQAVTFTSGRGSAEFTGLTPNTKYTVTFELGGVTQTDVQAAGQTLRNAPSSFVAVTGSCMFTASTHPIFDRIAADNPDFWTIQGDIHYEDSTTEAEWWAGMTASLNALRGLPRKIVTRWTADNHDTIRTDPLGGGAAGVPPVWKQMAGANNWASSDSIGQAWQNGRVLFIQADLRSARDNYVTGTAPLRLMGAAQKAWFKGLLTAAETNPDIALVVWFDNWIGLQQGSGRWGSYPDEYAELNAHIQSLTKVKTRLVLIGGDSHNLWADSGARSWPEAAFPGIPSLNMSGYNRAAGAETFYIPDIANASLQSSGAEADWGGYSRLTVNDDGGALSFMWEAVRVNAAGVSDVMASWSRTFSEPLTRTATGTLALSGTSSRTVTVERSTSGVLTLTGDASPAVTIARGASGSLTVDGTATRAIMVTRTASGSLALTGTADRAVTVVRSASGVLELTGTATTAGSTERTANGSLALLGTATPAVTIAREANGTLALGGIGTYTFHVIRTALGILNLTGQGVVDGEQPDWPARLTLTATIDTLNLEATVPTLTLEATW